MFTIIIPSFAFSGVSAVQNGVGQNTAKPCLENQIIDAANLIVKAKTLGVDPNNLSQLQLKLDKTVASIKGSSVILSPHIGCIDVKNYSSQSAVISSIVKTTQQLIAEKDQKVDSIGFFALQVSPRLGLVLVLATGVVTALTFETVRRIKRGSSGSKGIGSAEHSRYKNGRRQMFTFLICSVMIYSLVFFIAVNPRHEDPFYTLSVLDSNNSTSAYYPTKDGIINIGENVSWSVEAEGHKIPTTVLRLTVGAAGPSTALTKYLPETDTKTLAEYYHAAQNGGTWRLPLNWSIISAARSGNKVNLCVDLNGVATNVTLTSKSGDQRLVIGLWAFDPNQHSYRLESWLQMWFDILSYNSTGAQAPKCG